MRFPSLIGIVFLAGSGALAHHLPGQPAVDPATATDSAAESPAYDSPIEARLATQEPYTWSESYKIPMGLCQESTFTMEVDEAKSPLVADCEQLIDKLAQNTKQALQASGWEEDYQNIGEFAAICLKNDPQDDACMTFGTGSCTFGFRPDAYTELLVKMVGYTDIVDVMRDAISRVGDGKRVGTSGQFECGLDARWKTGTEILHWKIWNPNTQHGS